MDCVAQLRKDIDKSVRKKEFEELAFDLAEQLEALCVQIESIPDLNPPPEPRRVLARWQDYWGV